MSKDKTFMRLAIEQAQIAGRIGEVPIGALITDKNGSIISSSHNLREDLRDPTAHAEILAIRNASSKIGDWRLEGTCLYVTIEPCVMCIGAIVLARIDRLVFGARDEKAGGVFSVYNIGHDDALNHRLQIREGVYEKECAGLMTNFFRDLRR